MRSYRDRMADYATMRAIDIYYSSVAVTSVVTYLDKRARPMIESAVHSAAHHDSIHELAKLTAIVDSKRRIVDRPPVVVHRADATNPLVASALASYRASLLDDRRALLDRYEIVDYAMKVVGVGSVGLGAMILLLDGGSGADPLFLQAKEAQASVYERFIGPSQPALPRRSCGRGSTAAAGHHRCAPRRGGRRARPSAGTSDSSPTRRGVPWSRR